MPRVVGEGSDARVRERDGGAFEIASQIDRYYAGRAAILAVLAPCEMELAAPASTVHAGDREVEFLRAEMVDAKVFRCVGDRDSAIGREVGERQPGFHVFRYGEHLK